MLEFQKYIFSLIKAAQSFLKTHIRFSMYTDKDKRKNVSNINHMTEIRIYLNIKIYTVHQVLKIVLIKNILKTSYKKRTILVWKNCTHMFK